MATAVMGGVNFGYWMWSAWRE